jgi:Replication-relaxation
VREMRRIDCAALDSIMTIGAWRTEPRQKAKSVVGKTRDLGVLHSLAWAGFLSTGQIERLHFPSRRTAQRRLRALLDHGLVRACLQGSSLHLQNVYGLTPKGAAHLASLGISGAKPQRVVRAQKLEHALAVRDLFVAFALADQTGHIELEDFRFEDDLSKEPVFQSAGIIPDGLAIIRSGDVLLTVGCEVDLGSETGRMLRVKCALWAELLRSKPFGPMQLLFVVSGAGRSHTIVQLLNAAGSSGLTVLRSSVIEEPLQVVEGLFARAIRAPRIGIP